MRKFSLKTLSSRISRLNSVHTQKFFFCNKKYEPFINNSNEFNIPYNNLGDVEFEDQLSSAITFDINIDNDKKWKKQEEIEYNNFLKNIQTQRFCNNNFNQEGNLEEPQNGDINQVEVTNPEIKKTVEHIQSILDKYEINEEGKDETTIETIFDNMKIQSNKYILNLLGDKYINIFFSIIYKNLENVSYNNLVILINTIYESRQKQLIRDFSYEYIKFINKKNTNSVHNNNVNGSNNLGDSKLSENNEINLCLHILDILNNCSLYFSEYYDYLVSKINKMNTDQIVLFSKECSKHSLRTKHYLDKVSNICIEKINNFDIKHVQTLYYSFHRFPKEYSKFYDISLNLILENITSFDIYFYHLLLKIANNLKNEQKYAKLTASIANKINASITQIRKNINCEANNGSKESEEKLVADHKNKINEQCQQIVNSSEHNNETGEGELIVQDSNKIDKLKSNNVIEINANNERDACNTIVETIKCLKYLEYRKNNDDEVKNLVNTIYELINDHPEYLNLLSVEDVVYVLVCFTSYNKRIVLYNNLLDILCERSNELLHAKNISLWIYPILYLSKISWFHGNYFNFLFNCIKDNYVLSRLNIFQLLKLLSSIVKMNIYDEQIYKILIEKLFNEWDIIKKKFVDISTFLWSCAYVNIIYKPLFDEAYKSIINMIDSKSFSLDNAIYKNCFVNIAWAFIVGNYHKTEKDFDKILNVTFLNRDPNDSQAFKRLHQIADACFKEIPNCLVNLKSLDILYKYCMHEKCKTLRNDFNIYKKEKDAMKIKNKIIDEIAYILKKIHTSYQLYHEPYNNSPYIIDILLNKNQKIGICVYGKEHLMRTLTNSHWDYMNTGFTSLQMRILASHGWKIIPINGGEWLKLNTEQKKTHLQEYFKKYSIQV
ncbi:RAP protein, putative [Plasmodium vinckei brucechwatti]|uniref:RAP protein, putative n=1 Tax=Plasmodium vinckei brucechwatti TaxID=119398 RepID=A0A6V7SKD6_PLAVN|nr:RAP protein, putative [Plasmodium vinckei brucechwatti]